MNISHRCSFLEVFPQWAERTTDAASAMSSACRFRPRCVSSVTACPGDWAVGIAAMAYAASASAEDKCWLIQFIQ